MTTLLPTLAAELERDRSVTSQVIQHLSGSCGVSRDDVGAFLASQLPELEDYEVDLILSPLFTPTLKEQAVFAELLGVESVPRAQWPGLVQELVARPTRARLLTEDGSVHPIALREVSIERYVYRLRLDGTIVGPLWELLLHLPPPTDRPLLKAIARRAIWETPPRGEILLRFLTETASNDQYRLDDVLDLLKLMETYQPANAAELLGRLPQWRQVLRHEVSLAQSPKPFFNERVQELHGGGRDQRRGDQARVDAKERELAFFARLESALANQRSRP